MNFEAQWNALTRLLLLVFAVLYILRFPYDIHFLTVSLILIIGIFYIFQWCFGQKRQVLLLKEPYGRVESVLVPPPAVHWTQGEEKEWMGHSSPTDGNVQYVDPQQSAAWCSSYDTPLSHTYSNNQQLAGPPNPKTLVRPIIPNPIFERSAWQPNDFMVPSGINDQKRQELSQNGYVISSLPPPPSGPPSYSRNANHMSRPFHYSEEPVARNRTTGVQVREEYDYNDENSKREHFYGSDPSSSLYATSSYGADSDNVYYPLVDRACGYDPRNQAADLPVNYRSTSCERLPSHQEYNRNLFSIPLQPNVYTRSNINQPYASMSNLGISETDPFYPVLPESHPGSSPSSSSSLLLHEYAPSQVEEVPPRPYRSTEYGRPLRNEIYDPRLTGYGTSYRSYTDPLLGQPRFYYDDIDQHTRPNYITRNNLDIYGFAPQVGPFDPTSSSSLQGQEMRHRANQTFTDNQLLYRTELQQRLMRKNQNRQWQQRQAPIYTQVRSSRGGGTMT